MTNYFIHFTITLISLTIVTSVRADTRNDTCTPAQDAGTSSCTKKSETRWSFNGKYGRCVNFTFSGCGGNKNNFNSKEECRTACCSPKKVENNCTVVSISRDEIGCPQLEIACGEAAIAAAKSKKPKPNQKKSKTDYPTPKTTPSGTTKKGDATTKPTTKKPKMNQF